MRTFKPMTGEPSLDEPVFDSRLQRKTAEIIEELEKDSWLDSSCTSWDARDADDELTEREIGAISGIISELIRATKYGGISNDLSQIAANKLIEIYKPAVERLAEQLAKSWMLDMERDI